MIEESLVVPLDAANRIRQSDAYRGDLVVRLDSVEETRVVTRVQLGAQGNMLPVDIPERSKYLAQRGEESRSALWAQADPALHCWHAELRRRPDTATSFAAFRDRVSSVPDPGGGAALVLTYAPDIPDELQALGIAEFAAWFVSREQVFPWPVLVEPDTHGLAQLDGQWPVAHLAAKRALVVGTGSIGGRAAQSLTAYGIGNVDLLDPDRLLWHNTVRHVLSDAHVGRYKVNALRDTLKEHWPDLNIRVHRLDVVANADVVRPLLADVDIILCAADGVAPRRVVSHLARRAGKPAVLACVLEDGAVGEVLRLRPGPTQGCLLCQRDALKATGGIDPEAAQELGYGTGRVHRPMTAVGADLQLMGDLAAKVTVATLLEACGAYDQRLPGDHAVIALRPKPGLAAPFNAALTGVTTWHDLPRPRADCPTCSPP